MTEITRLANGLTVITVPLPGIETAAVGLHFDSGSRHEPDAVNGVAHMVEHMVFKGTATRSAKRIAEEIEDVGGQLNAYTSRDTTVFHARVLRADVDLATAMIADLVIAPTLDGQDFDKERQVVLQELGEAIDTPDDIIHDHLQLAAYEGQAIGRSILGTADSIGALTADDCRSWIAGKLTGGGAVLSAAGAVEHEAMVALAEGVLGRLAPSACAVPPPSPRFTGGKHADKRKFEQAHLTLGWEGPAVTHPDQTAMQLFTSAVGGGMSSRLFQELREERGLAYSIWANHTPFADTGLFTVYLACAPVEAARANDLVREVMAATAADLSEAELARARAQLKAGLLMSLEGAGGWADYSARQWMTRGRVAAPADIVARIDATGVDQVRAAATAMLAREPARATVGVRRAI